MSIPAEGPPLEHLGRISTAYSRRQATAAPRRESESSPLQAPRVSRARVGAPASYGVPPPPWARIVRGAAPALAVALLSSCARPESSSPGNTLPVPLAGADAPHAAASQSTPSATPSSPTASAVIAPATPSESPAVESLDAQRTKLIAAVRGELGSNVSQEVIADYYVLLGSKAAVAQSTDFVRRVLQAYFHGRFDKGVSRPLPILLFPDAGSYQAYCEKNSGAPCISRFGFFEPAAYRLVMNLGPGIGTLSHELVHPILEQDFPGAPTWLNEGIASLYEAPVMPKAGEIHGAKNWRYPRLIQGLRSAAEHEHATIAFLMRTTLSGFRDGKEDLHYAAARYLCQWLDTQGLLWPFYHRYRDSFSQDPRGEASFQAIVGEAPAEAQPKWERWVKAL